MTLYRIKDWNTRYENNRSRELKTLDWVPVTNRQDGDAYTFIMERPDGPSLYGAWMATVQVASRCDPRGTLLRDTSKPHDSASLSRMTRIPEGVIKKMFQVMSSEDVGWLICEELPTFSSVAPSCECENAMPAVECDPNPAPSGDKEGNGREEKGIEKKEDPAAPVSSAHVEFIDQWTRRFKKFFGFDYVVDGSRDGGAVKRLLHLKLSKDELLTIAEAAWRRSKSGNGRAWNCEKAITIHGFRDYFTPIRGELSSELQFVPPGRQSADHSKGFDPSGRMEPQT